MLRLRRTRRALAALFLAFLLTPAGAHAGQEAQDVRGWQTLLDRYCLHLGAKGEPADTRFDYEQLYVDEGIWTLKKSERLEKIHHELLDEATPSRMPARERLAWALNAWNFLVVERATLNLLVPNRKFQRYESVNDINLAGGTFFDSPAVSIEGRPYNLREFSRTFVYGDSTPADGPRRTAADPRLFFALCPGAAGGSPLAERAFRPESLDAQLDLASRTALALPRFVQFTPATGELVVADALNGNLADFGGTQTGILQFLEKHGPAELRSALRKRKVAGIARWQMMDWKLNQFERPKPKAPSPEISPKKS